MKVLVTVAPQALWHSCMAQFALLTAKTAALLTDAEAQLLEQSQTPAQLATLLNQYPQAEFAVAYEAPEVMLGRLLAAGNTPEEAAQQWFEQTEALLQLQQQQRRRVKLFSLSAAAHFAALPDWITLQAKAVPVVADTVYTLLAAQLLRQLPQHGALQQRLFASSLPLNEYSDYQVNLAGVLQQISDKTEVEHLTQAHSQSLQQLQNANAQLSASNDERDLLLSQLLQVQEELEQLFQKKTAVKQQYARLQDSYQNDVKHLTAQLDNGQSKVQATSKQLSSLQAELERITQAHNLNLQELNAASDERDLLLQQLLRVQEELEQYYLKWQQAEQKASHTDTARDKQQQRELAKLEGQLRKTKARAAGAEHQLQLLQQELGAVKNSTLWKSGAPVRVLKRLVTKTDKAKEKLQQEAALIITSEYFDIDWYLARYPDVAAGNINPAEHYLKFGASEGRMPGPLFDGDWYLQRYPDVATSGVNPLLHFIKFGQLEGRSASPKLLADHSTRED
ncbi:putative nucleic acid-binding Zn-ribbon protein [Rheinheimera pacifica]|uniref:hypothetical protein n=1 Tax=Rheinheimera pacifica TaxID=173990 RepID=UPI00285BB769|nr:hypothetical protein [Rheinheimera pacifica]MDR6984032.1 putative nucleic acid-binding Zn-ribbon protein [Rheinheimera pacifica]